MSFRSMFQDVREAMDSVHLSVGAVGRGLAERGEGGGACWGHAESSGDTPHPQGGFGQTIDPLCRAA